MPRESRVEESPPRRKGCLTIDESELSGLLRRVCVLEGQVVVYKSKWEEQTETTHRLTRLLEEVKGEREKYRRFVETLAEENQRLQDTLDNIDRGQRSPTQSSLAALLCQPQRCDRNDMPVCHRATRDTAEAEFSAQDQRLYHPPPVSGECNCRCHVEESRREERRLYGDVGCSGVTGSGQRGEMSVLLVQQICDLQQHLSEQRKWCAELTDQLLRMRQQREMTTQPKRKCTPS